MGRPVILIFAQAQRLHFHTRGFWYCRIYSHEVKQRQRIPYPKRVGKSRGINDISTACDISTRLTIPPPFSSMRIVANNSIATCIPFEFRNDCLLFFPRPVWVVPLVVGVLSKGARHLPIGFRVWNVAGARGVCVCVFPAPVISGSGGRSYHHWHISFSTRYASRPVRKTSTLPHAKAGWLA